MNFSRTTWLTGSIMLAVLAGTNLPLIFLGGGWGSGIAFTLCIGASVIWGGSSLK